MDKQDQLKIIKEDFISCSVGEGIPAERRSLRRDVTDFLMETFRG